MTLNEYKQYDPDDLMYLVDDDCRISTTTKNSHSSICGTTSKGHGEVTVILISSERNNERIVYQKYLSIKLIYRTKDDAIRKIESDYLKRTEATYNFDKRQWIREFKYLESARERIEASAIRENLERQNNRKRLEILENTHMSHNKFKKIPNGTIIYYTDHRGPKNLKNPQLWCAEKGPHRVRIPRHEILDSLFASRHIIFPLQTAEYYLGYMKLEFEDICVEWEVAAYRMEKLIAECIPMQNSEIVPYATSTREKLVVSEIRDMLTRDREQKDKNTVNEQVEKDKHAL